MKDKNSTPQETIAIKHFISLRATDNSLDLFFNTYRNFVIMVGKSDLKICFYWNGLSWSRLHLCLDQAMKALKFS